MLTNNDFIRCFILNKMSGLRKKKVCIVVLGDIGRSPRMQYHGLSFAREGYNVEFLSYPGSDPIEELRNNKSVSFRYMNNVPNFKKYLPTLVAYVVKVIIQCWAVFFGLILSNSPDFVLVQNPPAIPALFISYIYCKIFHSKFIIDWHNYSYSILALSLSSRHRLVELTRKIEFYLGKKADRSLCVTKAMKEDLEKNHNIKALTFYDRPPDFFKSPSIEEKHRVFLDLGLEYEVFVKDCLPGETVFTRVTEDFKIVLKESRPGLIISSTSWTEDEDFSLLLTALGDYDKLKSQHNLPDLICAITGKGPLKEFYQKIIESRNWSSIQVVTPWLKPEDYPVLLGAADLGVCLHTSASGFDLPMKVVDMFGCSLPVCAVYFNCLSELVKHEENGFIFNSNTQLLEQIIRWFTGFPKADSKIHIMMKENLKKFGSLRWHENWKLNVKPLF